MIRVMIAEDSPTMRRYLTELVEAAPDLSVAGVAVDGVEAIRLAEEQRPDLIVMDVHMPGADGLKATQRIMTRVPTPIIIISGSTRVKDVELSLSATQAGALLALPKPTTGEPADLLAFERELISMIRAMAQVKVVRRWATRSQPTADDADKRAAAAKPVGVIAIAASTGGPPALKQILAELHADYPVPILLVQHIARGFARGFAEWLGHGSGPAVRIAEPGANVRAGAVYVAGDDAHLGVEAGGRIVLSDDAPIAGFRPSATHLFRSVAAAYGAAAVALVLTGMGSDGVDGLADIRAAGGRVVAQDEASSVVFGMAQEATRRGCVDLTLPLAEIAAYLNQIAQRELNGSR